MLCYAMLASASSALPKASAPPPSPPSVCIYCDSPETGVSWERPSGGQPQRSRGDRQRENLHKMMTVTSPGHFIRLGTCFACNSMSELPNDFIMLTCHFH